MAPAPTPESDQPPGPDLTRAPILLTRPQAAAARFAAQITARLGPQTIVTSPVLRIVPLGPPPDLNGITGLILTSERGLRADIALPPGLPAYCVGARTAAAAAARGLAVRSANGALPDLIALIRAAAPPGPLLHLRGRFGAGDAVGALNAAGIAAREAAVYDQCAQPLSEAAQTLLAGAGPVVIPVFSPRSAEILAPALRAARAKLLLAAISPAVAQALPVQSASEVMVAETPDSAGMMDRIAQLQSGLRA